MMDEFDELTNTENGDESSGGSGGKQKRARVTHASNSRLPLAATGVHLSPSEANEAAFALQQLLAVRVQISELKERQDALETQLAAICSLYNLPGLRSGLSY